MSQKKSPGEVIGAELQESLAHLGTAATVAGRVTAEQFRPQVEAAVKVAQQAYTSDVAPRVGAAVAALAPQLDAAREVLVPRLEAAQKTYEKDVVPRLEAAGKLARANLGTAVAATTPRIDAARTAATPAAQAAAKAARANLEAAVAAATPRIEAARTNLEAAIAAAGPRIEAAREQAGPRLSAATSAATAYAAPRVAAARDAAVPVLGTAREGLTTGVEVARDQAAARVAAVAAATEAGRKSAGKKAQKLGKKADKLSKKAAKRRVALEKATASARKDAVKRAAAATVAVKRGVGIEPKKAPRRWPWALAVLAAVAAGVVVLIRRNAPEDQWTPAPAGDGPVPSYREDPAPMASQTPAGGSETPEFGGKTVSSAQTAPSDSGPAEGGIGALEAQPASGPGEPGNQDRPTAASSTYNDPDTPVTTAGPRDDVVEGPGAVDPRTDATNATDTPRGPAGTPIASRGVQPGAAPDDED